MVRRAGVDGAAGDPAAAARQDPVDPLRLRPLLDAVGVDRARQLRADADAYADLRLATLEDTLVRLLGTVAEIVMAGVLYYFAPSATRRALREEVVVAEAANG